MVAQVKLVGHVLPAPQTMPQWSAVIVVVAMTQRPVPGPANVHVASSAHGLAQKPVASVGTALRQSQPLAQGLAVVHRWPRPQPPTAEPPQTPAVQASPEVQPSLSLHGVVSGAAGLEQPVDGLHVPARWHWSLAEHVTVVPPAQVPVLVHRSPLVQALPSLQEVPVALSGLLHTPVVVLQVPMSWH